jgi:hypothetical protein
MNPGLVNPFILQMQELYDSETIYMEWECKFVFISQQIENIMLIIITYSLDIL